MSGLIIAITSGPDGLAGIAVIRYKLKRQKAKFKSKFKSKKSKTEGSIFDFLLFEF